MRPQRSLLLVLVAMLPVASATTYGAGSELEANAPVLLEGLVDTWLPGGIASFVGSGSDALLSLRLEAPRATLTYTTDATGCASFGLPGAPCPPGASEGGVEEIALTSLTVSVAQTAREYKLLATTDRAYADTPAFGDAGRILVSTVSGASLGTNGEGRHLSPSTRDWEPDARAQQPVYEAASDSSELKATGARVRGTGGFETFYQGVKVAVRGFDADGDEVERTFDTTAKDGAPRFLRIEVAEGLLDAGSTGPVTGYAPAAQRPVSDVHSRAILESASGTLVKDGDRHEIDGERVTLSGPVSLTLVKIGAGRLTYTVTDGLQLGDMAELAEDEPLPTGALAAAGAAGAGGAGLLIALAYFWPRLKFAATLLLLPLYTRIERDAVLEHEKRDELYELIRVTPGIHAHEIGERAKIGWGTTVYHLKLLENHGLVVSKKSGRYKRFFVNTGEYTKKKDIYGALRNETAKAVADHVVNHPGTTQKELCAALGIQPSLASWHVEKLEGVELVKRVKDGRMVRYFAGPAWADLNVRVDPVGGADAPAET